MTKKALSVRGIFANKRCDGAGNADNSRREAISQTVQPPNADKRNEIDVNDICTDGKAPRTISAPLKEEQYRLRKVAKRNMSSKL